jgi:Leucine-rich repeat (LRR) protein
MFNLQYFSVQESSSIYMIGPPVCSEFTFLMPSCRTLASMGFTGVLSPRIGELEYLNVLSLPGNNITGGIPEQFGNLSRLTNLDLEDNLLVGPIPASLGQLSKLQILYVLKSLFLCFMKIL